MLACTDRHLRYFYRLISKNVVLYSEMVTTGALIFNDPNRFLSFNDLEHPVVLQLGGNDPSDLAKCAKMVESFGYDEVNLNVGCPSERVQSGRFGACLMAEPDLVADCVSAMCESVNIPVSIKTRIGIDLLDSYEYLSGFIDKLSKAGCSVFIIHARKALLSKFSPKENREKTPINYEVVYQIKRDFPQLEIIINGDITSVDSVGEHLKYVDGVMIGRLAYQNPYILSFIDHLYSGETTKALSRHALVTSFLPYIQHQLDNGLSLHSIARHLLPLFQGVPGARSWRRYISENALKKGAGTEVLEKALTLVSDID